MASSGPNPLPPTTILSTKYISQSAAHDFLAAYLDRAATDPALQPNATISEHGPVSRTTAAAPNLILHNLRRIQAGLAGEVLGRDLTLPSGTQPEPQQESENQKEGDGTGEAQVDAGEDWEDRQKWDLGLVNEVTHSGVQVENGDFINDTEDIQVDKNGMPVKKIDKEERKRKKKERRQAEKKGRAKQINAVDEMSEW